MILTTLSLASLLASAAAGAAPAPQKPTAIDYVEFKVQDIDRSKAFYGAIFGWTFTDYGPAYTSFMSNGLGGGFSGGEEPPRPGGPLMVFHVDNLEACLARATAQGAVIVKPIFAFPGGRRFEFRDPDGYLIAAWTQE
jgi:uncharacterized protein